MTSHNYKPLEVGHHYHHTLGAFSRLYHASFSSLLFSQVLWTFSIYLEAVAILPQLVLLQRTQNIDNLTGNYVFLLG
jgi:ER lumen protein retaining receptor